MIDPAERDWQEITHDHELCACASCGYEAYYYEFVARSVDELFELYEAGEIDLHELDYHAFAVTSGSTHVCRNCGSDEYPIYLSDYKND